MVLDGDRTVIEVKYDGYTVLRRSNMDKYLKIQLFMLEYSCFKSPRRSKMVLI